MDTVSQFGHAAGVEPNMAVVRTAEAVANADAIAEERRLADFYQKLLILRDQVLTGSHPHIKLPPSVIASYIASQQTVAAQPAPPTPVTSTSVSPAIPGLFQSALTQTQQQSASVASASPNAFPGHSHAPSQPPNSDFRSLPSRLDTFEKQVDTVQIELQKQRKYMENALQEQLDQQRRTIAPEFTTDIDVDEVLAKAIARIQPISGFKPRAVTQSPSHDSSFNSYYSSQAPEWTSDEDSEMNRGKGTMTGKVSAVVKQPTPPAPAQPKPQQSSTMAAGSSKIIEAAKAQVEPAAPLTKAQKLQQQREKKLSDTELQRLEIKRMEAEMQKMHQQQPNQPPQQSLSAPRQPSGTAAVDSADDFYATEPGEVDCDEEEDDYEPPDADAFESVRPRNDSQLISGSSTVGNAVPSFGGALPFMTSTVNEQPRQIDRQAPRGGPARGAPSGHRRQQSGRHNQQHLPPNGYNDESSGSNRALAQDNNNKSIGKRGGKRGRPSPEPAPPVSRKERKRQAAQQANNFDPVASRTRSRQEPTQSQSYGQAQRSSMRSPEIQVKEEPVSPPLRAIAMLPLAASGPSRHSRDEVEVMHSRQLRAPPYYDLQSHLSYDPYRPELESQSLSASRPVSAARRRDDEDLRRVASLQYARRPEADRLPGFQGYTGEPRGRAASYATREAPPYPRGQPAEVTRMRSRSPRPLHHEYARYGSPPDSPGLPMMAPPPLPRVVYDQYGNRYVAAEPENVRQARFSVAPSVRPVDGPETRARHDYPLAREPVSRLTDAYESMQNHDRDMMPPTRVRQHYSMAPPSSLAPRHRHEPPPPAPVALEPPLHRYRERDYDMLPREYAHTLPPSQGEPELSRSRGQLQDQPAPQKRYYSEQEPLSYRGTTRYDNEMPSPAQTPYRPAEPDYGHPSGTMPVPQRSSQIRTGYGQLTAPPRPVVESPRQAPPPRPYYGDYAQPYDPRHPEPMLLSTQRAIPLQESAALPRRRDVAPVPAPLPIDNRDYGYWA